MDAIVVSAVGAILPHGEGAETCWEGIRSGRSAIAPIRSYDVSGHPVQIAAECPDPTRSMDTAPHGRSAALMASAWSEAMVSRLAGANTNLTEGSMRRPRKMDAAATKSSRRPLVQLPMTT